MKSLFFIPTTLLVLIFSSCGSKKEETYSTESNIYTMQKDSSDLILNISTRPFDLAVGYGNVYNCKVNKTEKGFVEDTTLSIVVLAGDNQKDSIFLNSSITKNKLEIGFKKYRESEPYKMMPISGFVDCNNTSWKVTYIKSIP